MWRFITTYVYFCYLRPLLKWFLRLTTGKCELLRITNSEATPYKRSNSIEFSLIHSKHSLVYQSVKDTASDVDKSVLEIAKLKGVKTDCYPQFIPRLTLCLNQISGYNQLISEVEEIRRVPYSSDNDQHERLLLQLWSVLKPDEQLTSRVTKQWTEIGFQGKDPKTDFRGMGLLGLQNLLYFAIQYTDRAHQLLSKSCHPTRGLSFAVVGINFTSMAYELLVNGDLKPHFYNSVMRRPSLADFQDVYVFLFYNFNNYWLFVNPVDIMQFNIIREQFQNIITGRLRTGSFQLQMDMSLT